HFGADGERLYLRIDFHESKKEDTLAGIEVRLGVQTPAEVLKGSLGAFDSTPGGAFVPGAAFPGAQCCFRNILEAAIPLSSLGVAQGETVRFQFSLWKDGLPMAAVPGQGWLEAATSSSDGWAQ